MPDQPIVDTHLHLWDPRHIAYPWLASVPALNRPFPLEDFRAASAGVAVASLVFVQCEAAFEQFEAEADWVEEQALAGVGAADRDRFWRGNAQRFYRLAA